MSSSTVPTADTKNSIDVKHSSRVEKFLVGPSTSNLVNIATCKSTTYSAVGRYHTVMSRNNITGSMSLFYTVGIVSHSDLVTGSKSHQICVMPSDLAWNRIAAVMGAIFGQKKLALSVFHNGISYSTLKWTERTSTNQTLNTLGMSTSASTSQSASNVPLSYNTRSKFFLSPMKAFTDRHIPSSVPTYDGCNPFHLAHFKSLPCIDTELAANSAVLITFSLGAYNLTDGGALNIGVTLSISNNVQSVILLADPHPYTPHSSDNFIPSNTPLHLGILTKTDSSD
jgi:hypothetical protein